MSDKYLKKYQESHLQVSFVHTTGKTTHGFIKEFDDTHVIVTSSSAAETCWSRKDIVGHYPSTGTPGALTIPVSRNGKG